jgi:hypothetical protein
MAHQHQSSERASDVASVQDKLIDEMTASQQEALETVESASRAMFDGMARVQHELADFVAERIRQDMETQQEFLRCRTLDDVRQVQTRFFRTAFDQYAAEANKLLKLGSELAARSLERTHA